MLTMQSEVKKWDYIVEKISRLAENADKKMLIAIDGRCASGKTTFAGYVSKALDCNVFHMDDYFLRPEQRTAERLKEPGGNVDRERFNDELLIPLTKGTETIEYRKFDCHTMSLQLPVTVSSKKINIVEGAYSCHPDLIDKYDLKIFFDITKELQRERILNRNGSKQWEVFRDRWIPMEERYFEEFGIRERCDMCVNGYSK